MMAKPTEQKPTKGKPEEKKIDFSHVAKKFANTAEEQHLNQIGPSLTEVYLKNTQYQDNKGVNRYTVEFDENEVKTLSDKLYDNLGYHLHRRYLGMDENSYNNLLKIKDPNGKPYVDMFTEHHFNIDRDTFQKQFGERKKGNKISMKTLQSILEKPMESHAGKVSQGIISKDKLNDPKNMGLLKEAIDKIVAEFKENPEDYNTAEMYDPNEVLGSYLRLASQHYRKGAHPEYK